LRAIKHIQHSGPSESHLFSTPFSYFSLKRTLALQLPSEETLRLAMTGFTLLSLLGSTSTKHDDRVTHRASCLIYLHAGKLMHS